MLVQAMIPQATCSTSSHWRCHHAWNWPLLAALALVSASLASAADDAASHELHGEECRDECNSDVMLLQLGLQVGQTEEAVAQQQMISEGRRMHAAAEPKGRHDDCEEEPILTQAFQILDRSNTTLDQSWVATHTPKYYGIKFSIRGHNLTWNLTRVANPAWVEANANIAQHYANMFSPLVEQNKFPDMDFAVDYKDNARGALGVFLGEGHPGQEILTMPRSLVLRSEQVGVSNVDNPPVCAGEHKNLAVFRGSTTGATEKPHIWTGNNLPIRDINGDPTPRYEAALLSKRRPDLLDAGFSGVAGDLIPKWKWEEALRKEGLWKNFLSYEEQSCYSVILVIDGNTVADRLAEQMSWGLPVVLVRKRESSNPHARKNEEFWYPELISWKHYVLATTDTLETVLETLLANAELRKQIGHSGQQFIKQRLSPERLACYNLKLLSLYGERYHS